MNVTTAGVSLPNVRPVPRDARAIIDDFCAAADHVAAIGADWRAGQFRSSDITGASNLLEGLARLLVELRQGGAP